jgi:hypothetical protein
MSVSITAPSATELAGMAGSPLLAELQEMLPDTTFHDPADPMDDPVMQAILFDPMVKALFRAHQPLKCTECWGISPAEISDDWVAFSRNVDHVDGCPNSSN